MTQPRSTHHLRLSANTKESAGSVSFRLLGRRRARPKSIRRTSACGRTASRPAGGVRKRSEEVGHERDQFWSKSKGVCNKVESRKRKRGKKGQVGAQCKVSGKCDLTT